MEITKQQYDWDKLFHDFHVYKRIDSRIDTKHLALTNDLRRLVPMIEMGKRKEFWFNLDDNDNFEKPLYICPDWALYLKEEELDSLFNYVQSRFIEEGSHVQLGRLEQEKKEKEERIAKAKAREIKNKKLYKKIMQVLGVTVKQEEQK